MGIRVPSPLSLGEKVAARPDEGSCPPPVVAAWHSCPRVPRDREVVPVEDAGPMPFQCVGHCLENLDAGGPGAGTPVFKEPACDGFVGLLPDLTEILFQIVGDR